MFVKNAKNSHYSYAVLRNPQSPIISDHMSISDLNWN